MPARDRHHNAVRHALIRDGWQITHDPLLLPWDDSAIFIDLGAEGLIGAEQEGRKIAVEVKTFASPSIMVDFEQAIGQFVVYRDALSDEEPERVLYLAVAEAVARSFLARPKSNRLLARQRILLLIFSVDEEVIIEWTS